MNYEIILDRIKDNSKLIRKLDSFTLYQILLLLEKTSKYNDLIIKNEEEIIKKITSNYDFFDILIHLLLNRKIKNEKLSNSLKNTIFKIFNSKTLLFLNKINNINLENGYLNKQEIFNCVFYNLEKLDNNAISVILYNLNLLEDFNKELKRRFPILELLLSSYQKFDIEKMTNNSYKGSSILGCLIKDNNQYLVEDYINRLLKNKNSQKITCIGAGSTCLVYKINDNVLKLSETRNCRKIFVNHRILASQVRKLLKDQNEELFYIEIMKYLQNTNVTQEECDELKEDLYRQGMYWEDAKIENCGLLNDKDLNNSDLEMNYSEIYSIIDNPIDKEMFMKRKRKVVVLDNDNIKPVPGYNWK